MFWFLLALIAVALICSRLTPGSNLARSAADAFDANVRFLARYGAVDDVDVVDEDAAGVGHVSFQAARDPTPSWLRQASAQRIQPNSGRETREAHNSGPSWKTSVARKRPTPLMQKKVAVRYGFRYALCNEPLDETWETDHIVPLSEARSMRDAELLNSIDNLQPVHRACHQLKTSTENTRAAGNGAR